MTFRCWHSFPHNRHALKPLILLVAGVRQFPALTNKQAERTNDQMNDFEAGLKDLSSNRELVVAENSGHYIHFDRPKLVIDYIRRGLDAARDGSQSSAP